MSGKNNPQTRLLLYGFGNPGRFDDGLGIDFVNSFTQSNDAVSLTVESNYQLNGEDALLLSEHDYVVFVDASENNIEQFRLSEVTPANEIAFTTHAMAPDSVLALCTEVYGETKTPPTYLLEIKGYSWGIGEGLSEQADKNLKAALEFLQEKVNSGKLFQQSAMKEYSCA